MRVQVYTAWGPMLLPARVKTIEEGEVFCRELIYVLEQMEGTGMYLHELRQELRSFLRKEKIDEDERTIENALSEMRGGRDPGH